MKIIGDNLIPYAFNYQNAEFVGVDLSSQAIELGHQRIKELDLKKVFLEDLASKNTLEINYENFENIGSQKLPKNVKIIIQY